MTDSSPPGDRSAYGDPIRALHDRALEEGPSDQHRGTQRFMDWFDREVASNRREPAAPGGAVPASTGVEEAASGWRSGALRIFAVGLCAVGLLFVMVVALSGTPSGRQARSGTRAAGTTGSTASALEPTWTMGPARMPLDLSDPCRQAVRATGNAPLIDDFEDGNELVSLQEGRNGYWVIITDSDPAASETVLVPSLFPQGRPENRSALHVAGGRHTKWGASVQLELGPSCYDASVYRGIAFDVRGPGRLYAGVRVIDVVPVDRGGTCTADCYESHLAPVYATGEWRHHELTWSELHQRGKTAAADAHRLSGLEFLIRGEDTPYDLWIDNVTFVR